MLEQKSCVFAEKRKKVFFRGIGIGGMGENVYVTVVVQEGIQMEMLLDE